MTTNEIVLYIALPVVVIVLIVLSMFLLKRTKKTKVETEAILTLFNKDIIKSVSYIRNKIVVEFSNVKEFQYENLKEYGATGINIIGDKVKFYFDDNNTTNSVYESLKNHIK